MTPDPDSLTVFVEEALASGEVWIIEDAGGMAVVHSHLLPRDAVPFWSSRHRAELCCCNDWEDFNPRAVRIEKLLNVMIPQIEEHHALIGVNWGPDMTGSEHTPDELVARLR